MIRKMERDFFAEGGMVESNCEYGIGELYDAVAKKIQERHGKEWSRLFPTHPVYSLDSFIYNVASINEDMDMKRIPEARTFDDWVDKIVNEYSLNFSRFKERMSALK